jgi:ABC-type lipoprotein release transport system permease subunit
MGMVTRISFRNLVRQKRRNILLGIGIALSMCLLVISISFVNGISDNFFNNILVYMTGHINVVMREKDGSEIDVIRDRERIMNIAYQSIPDVLEVWEDVSVFARCLGNGKAASMAFVGIWNDEGYKEFFDIVEGSVDALFDTDDNYPGILIYDNTAENLNVHVDDIIKVKVTNIYGVVDNRNFKVAAIARAGNMFMSMAGFVEINALKDFMGYKEYETGSLNVILKNGDNPLIVKEAADLFHEYLKPEAAGISGILYSGDNKASVNILSLNFENEQLIKDIFSLSDEEYQNILNNEDSVLISRSKANVLDVSEGQNIDFSYISKFENDNITGSITVTGIFEPDSTLQENIVFMHEDLFCEYYFPNLPQTEPDFDSESELFPVLVKQWILLERTNDPDANRLKFQHLKRSDWQGTILDIQTMYENEIAQGIIQLAQSLNLISFIAIFLLFFIILIGVVNTLRMSIRERTREIGTNRAIGMLKKDVRRIFIMEVFYLTVFACIAGLILAFILMSALGSIVFEMNDNPLSLLLVNNSIYFLPTVPSIIFSFLSILVIAVAIAYFPSGRAAKMKIADALRHYE